MKAILPAAVPTAAAADSWADAPRRPQASSAPVLTAAGFEGPLDWLVEVARAQRIDLAKLSIEELVDAFVTALDAALAEQAIRADLSRWGEWLVMAATLALLRSRLLLPPDAPDARAAQDEAEAMHRQLRERVAIRQAAEWLDRRPTRPRRVRAWRGDRRGRGSTISFHARSCCSANEPPRDSSSPPRKVLATAARHRNSFSGPTPSTSGRNRASAPPSGRVCNS